MINLGGRRGPYFAPAAFPEWGKSESHFKGDNDATCLTETEVIFHYESWAKGWVGVARMWDT